MTNNAMVPINAPTAVAVRANGAEMSFGEMLAMGEQLVRTGFLPGHLRTGAQVAAVILTGRELGMAPMQAIRSLVLVKGKVTEAADSQLARFKTQGGRAQFEVLTEQEARLRLRHPNGDEHLEVFTLRDAQTAGLTGGEGWKKYPKAMLRSRAITAGLKSLGWEGAVGNYDPDELASSAAPLAPIPADMVHVDTAEHEVPALARPQVMPPTLSFEEAEDIVLKGRRLGDMSDERLTAVQEWAAEKGHEKLLVATTLVLEARAADGETIDGATDELEEGAA